ncbi:MAG: DEAD/DEAH box helicase [Opitutales bacterium]
MSFSNLKLVELIQKTLAAEGYEVPTPIQKQAIPHVLEGRDVLGCAQTGTGKTAAFALPILQRLAAKPAPHGAQRHVRCLVLCPTRELATQIGLSFRTYGQGLDVRHTTIFGGVNQKPQASALRHGVDVVVATPGRLLDLLQQRLVDLRHVEVLVLDEADRMLDMGFIHDIRKIVAVLPAVRQNLLFSATMPTEIRRLADTILRNPVSVQVAPAAATADHIDQSVYFVEKNAKPALLAKLFNELPMSRALVFTRTKHGADRVVKHLRNFGINAEAIHGNKSQNARERALANFKAQKTPILVATDIASRGIDIDDISHVVNYDLTHEPETYIHRIGRTARAGAAGCAVSFCDHEELSNLRAIERLIRISIPVKSGPLPRASQASTPAPQRYQPGQQNREYPRPEHRGHQPSVEHRHDGRPQQHRDYAQPEHRSHDQAGHAHQPNFEPKAQGEQRNQHPKLEYRQQPKPAHRPEQQADHRHAGQHPKHRPAGHNAAHRPGGGVPKHGTWRPAAHRGRPAFAAH